MFCSLSKFENFPKITNNNFNQYNVTLKYLENNSVRSNTICKKQKLMNCLAKKLGICPRLLDSKIKQTSILG